MYVSKFVNTVLNGFCVLLNAKISYDNFVPLVNDNIFKVDFRPKDSTLGVNRRLKIR
jgi:hypothetical protein